jgi:DNA-directed RNA polymerase subunit beta'
VDVWDAPVFLPIVSSTTTMAFGKDGFLSAAGFQETRRILTKAAIEGKCDWLNGLKASIMSGKLIPAGSSFFNAKYRLDLFYLHTKLQKE